MKFKQTPSLASQIQSVVPLVPDEVFDICANLRLLKFKNFWSINKTVRTDKNWYIIMTKLEV